MGRADSRARGRGRWGDGTPFGGRARSCRRRRAPRSPPSRARRPCSSGRWRPRAPSSSPPPPEGAPPRLRRPFFLANAGEGAGDASARARRERARAFAREDARVEPRRARANVCVAGRGRGGGRARRRRRARNLRKWPIPDFVREEAGGGGHQRSSGRENALDEWRERGTMASVSHFEAFSRSSFRRAFRGARRSPRLLRPSRPTPRSTPCRRPAACSPR